MFYRRAWAQDMGHYRKAAQMERWAGAVTLPDEDWKRKKRKLNSQIQRYCRSDTHRHPKISIPWANSIKNTYSPSTCLRSKARWNTFFQEVQKLKKNYLLLFLLLLLFLNSMNYFHREPETKTKRGVTKVSCKHRDRTQCTKSSAPFQSLQACL